MSPLGHIIKRCGEFYRSNYSKPTRKITNINSLVIITKEFLFLIICYKNMSFSMRFSYDSVMEKAQVFSFSFIFFPIISFK